MSSHTVAEKQQEKCGSTHGHSWVRVARTRDNRDIRVCRLCHLTETVAMRFTSRNNKQKYKTDEQDN